MYNRRRERSSSPGFTRVNRSRIHDRDGLLSGSGSSDYAFGHSRSFRTRGPRHTRFEVNANAPLNDTHAFVSLSNNFAFSQARIAYPIVKRILTNIRAIYRETVRINNGVSRRTNTNIDGLLRLPARDQSPLNHLQVRGFSLDSIKRMYLHFQVIYNQLETRRMNNSLIQQTIDGLMQRSVPSFRNVHLSDIYKSIDDYYSLQGRRAVSAARGRQRDYVISAAERDLIKRVSRYIADQTFLGTHRNVIDFGAGTETNHGLSARVMNFVHGTSRRY